MFINPHIDVRYYHISAPTQCVRRKSSTTVLLSWPAVTAEHCSELPDVMPLVPDMRESGSVLHFPSQSVYG